jgi:hypothetical protein
VAELSLAIVCLLSAGKRTITSYLHQSGFRDMRPSLSSLRNPLFFSFVVLFASAAELDSRRFLVFILSSRILPVSKLEATTCLCLLLGPAIPGALVGWFCEGETVSLMARELQ